jgi:HD-like signal output (HDOD) protein
MTHTLPAAPAAPAETDDPLAVALRRIVCAGEFPALSRRMSELLACLSADELSAQRLATFVLHDYSLTLKVVRTANAVHYNRSHRPIRSVTQAMMMLGVETVRSLAASLLLFEHYRSRSPGLKELLLLSLLSANHAREAGVRLGVAEPETVHLSGMCRNLGEVLVACHFPDEYAGILHRAREQLAAGAPHDAGAAAGSAARQVLGFSFEDLGDGVLAHWGMPEEIRWSLRATGRVGESLAHTLTAFGHDLTAAVYRGDGERAGAASGATAVLGKYGDRLRLTKDGLRDVLAAAVAETREVFSDAGMSLDSLRLARQTAGALAELGDTVAVRDTAAPPADATAGRAPALTPSEGAGQARGAGLVALRERLVADLEAALPPEAGHALHPVLLMALEALVRAGPASRALFCLVSPDRTLLEARLGLGVGAERLAAEFRVPLGHGDAGGAARALHARRDVVLTDGRHAPREEARWVRALGARQVTLLPLVVDDIVIGSLYADLSDEAAPPDAATRLFHGTVRSAAARAIALRRRATPATPTPATPTSAPADPAAGAAVAVERRDVVLRLLRGATPAALSAELGVPVETIEEWQRSFLEGALAGLQNGTG